MGTKVESAAAMLGRLGGLKGGKARARALTAAKRQAIARKGAVATNKIKRRKARAAKRKAAA